MCHFALYIHPCGDSYYLKYSSCSYDRFAHHPESALNPLHPLTRPNLHEATPSSFSTENSLSSSTAHTSSTWTSVSENCEPKPGAVSDLSRPKGGGEMGKCYIFEVVLQKREPMDCPSCRRSERRRKLPARSRGIFAPS